MTMTLHLQWIATVGIILLVSYNLCTSYFATVDQGNLSRGAFLMHVALEEYTKTAPTAHVAPKNSWFTPANESFAACLMTSDDNWILSEWIAYHYTVLPLRALVVANDPRSKQSPLDVLEKWENTSEATRDNAAVLQYWIWDDSDYMKSSELKLVQEILEKRGNHHQLKLRQRHFISACTKFFKEQNRTWVSFTDSDEFITFNKVHATDDEELRFSDDSARSIPNTTIGELVQLRESVPNNTTVLEAIRKIQNVLPRLGPCHTMPRLLHGSLETANCSKTSRQLAQTNDHLASLFKDAIENLTTLRYFQHAGKNSFDNRWGKVIMDVSRLHNSSVYQTFPRNIHRPYPAECIVPMVPMAEAPFRVHHYIGPWERFSSRSYDSRRTNKSWVSRSSMDIGDSCDLEIHKWLPRFVNVVGVEKAIDILKWH